MNQFTILSPNIESIHSKINMIQAYVDSYRSNDFEFDALCFQECWLSDENTNHIQIDGHNYIYQGKSCSGKGLVIYLRNIYNYEIIKSIKASKIWEGIFIDIKDGGLKRMLTLGNIYRPPRNVNENYEKFIEEITPILEIFVGDFNIDLLKITEKEAFSKFYDTLITNSFIPTITYPTRFSNTNGTLIDNALCKLSDVSLNSASGIFVDQFSDHMPFFHQFRPHNTKTLCPKFIDIKKCSVIEQDALIKELSEYDVENELAHDCNCNVNPNDNYNKLENYIVTAISKHMSTKRIKYNKHKHRKSPWMTTGILKSIKRLVQTKRPLFDDACM